MDGLADFVLRDVLTRIGGYDAALFPVPCASRERCFRARTFERVCPQNCDGGLGCCRDAGQPPVAR